MKILYLANVRFPTEMAHGAQIAKSCEAFAAAGQEVELVVPDRYTPIEEPAASYYGLSTPFPVRRLTVPDMVRHGGRLGFFAQSVLFGFAAARYVRKAKPDVVYCREEYVLAILLLLGIRTIVWESHDGAWNHAARFVVRRVSGMVVVTEGQRAIYIKRGVPGDKIVAVPNGFDEPGHVDSKESARRRLDLPEGIIALYAGAFGGWKGTDTLFKASLFLPDGVHIAVIGGRPEQVAELSHAYPRVIFLGERPYRELADNLAAADICILPNTGKDPISVQFTSPLKLLAYMAAGKPIVASDLPSVRELVGDDAALLVPADDPSALAQGIMNLANDTAFARRLATRAAERVTSFYWPVRAKRILAHITLRTATPILAIYRGRLTENRGTPIRVRSLLERLAKDDRFRLTIASWDESFPFCAEHLHLTNRKLADLRVLSRAARSGKANIVIGHTMATWYYLVFLKVVWHAKIVLEMHGFLEIEALFYGSIGRLRATVEGSVYSVFYRLCDLITTCSENAAEILTRYNRNVVPLYGGVDTALFHPDAVPLHTVVHNPGEIIIGYAGNLRKWQGVPFLLSAFAKLRAEDSSFRLAILTSEEWKGSSEMGIQVLDGVPHEAVPAFLAACDILVIPRLDDSVSRISFPSKLPEYLAMAKPVVASATSDADRVISDGVNGVIFIPGDEDSLLAALKKLRDPERRVRMGDAARATAERNFSWDRQSAILAERILSIT